MQILSGSFLKIPAGLYQKKRHEVCSTNTYYTCGVCEKVYQVKSDFMNHRKNEHIEMISECTQYKNGSCGFGSEKCWYKHGNIIENMHVEPTDMISRLFGMIEKFTKRMEEIERQLYNEIKVIKVRRNRK